MVAPNHGSSLLCSLLLGAANILIPISILVFATGFFPYKPFLPGLAEYESLDYGPPPPAPFDRLIFMVVDALRRYALTYVAPSTPLTHILPAILYTRTTQASNTFKGETLSDMPIRIRAIAH